MMTIEEKRRYHREWIKKDRIKKPEKYKQYGKKWRDGHRPHRNQKVKDWTKSHPEERKRILWAARLKHDHGISSEKYEEMSRIQGGVCAICGGVNQGKRRLAVDHNHKTEEKRGLLCNSCNRGLGDFRDNVTFLEGAIAYLRKWE